MLCVTSSELTLYSQVSSLRPIETALNFEVINSKLNIQ